MSIQYSEELASSLASRLGLGGKKGDATNTENDATDMEMEVARLTQGAEAVLKGDVQPNDLVKQDKRGDVGAEGVREGSVREEGSRSGVVLSENVEEENTRLNAKKVGKGSEKSLGLGEKKGDATNTENDATDTEMEVARSTQGAQEEGMVSAVLKGDIRPNDVWSDLAKQAKRGNVGEEGSGSGVVQSGNVREENTRRNAKVGKGSEKRIGLRSSVRSSRHTKVSEGKGDSEDLGDTQYLLEALSAAEKIGMQPKNRAGGRLGVGRLDGATNLK